MLQLLACFSIPLGVLGLRREACFLPVRLVAEVGDSTLRLPLKPGENLVGSGRECDVQISAPTVSRNHAVVVVGQDLVQVADLDSANGTFIDGRQIRRPTEVTTDQTIAFGAVSATVQEIAQGDAKISPVVAISGSGTQPTLGREPASARPTTASTHPLQLFSLGLLPQLMRLLAERVQQIDVAQAAGIGLVDLFQGWLEISRSDTGRILFRSDDAVESSPSLEAEAEHPPIESSEGSILLRFRGKTSDQEQLVRPLLAATAQLIGLAQPAPQRPAKEDGRRQAKPNLVSLDPAMQEVLRNAERIARGRVSVLILGESGTGKEVIANYIHAASPRAGQPLVALNCAALPQDLLEAELFGIEGGVATGVEARAGRFEQAHAGTLFLDEIGDMHLEVQAKLLRILEAGEVYRVGGTAPRPADVRILAATNRDLSELIAGGGFREDLYHRIADWECRIPPLRERVADIPNLLALFLERECAENGTSVAGVTEEALSHLLRYSWPGNVRELEREVRRGVLLLEGGQAFDSTVLSEALRGVSRARRSLVEILEEAERREIERVLIECGGAVSRAAELLGVPTSTFYRRLKKLGVKAAEDLASR